MLSYFQSAKSKSIMDENVWRNGLLSKNVHDHFRNDKTIKALFKNNAYINKVSWMLKERKKWNEW